MSASLDLAAPKLGSGARFRKLSATLAARGASNPDALAAYIGRRKYGSGGMGRLSHGKSLANLDLGIYLAADDDDDQLTCPQCGHTGSADDFGASGTDVQSQPEELRTPAPSTGFVRDGAATTVRSGNAAHALANTRSAIELATGTLTARRHPVREAADVRVSRQPDGSALLVHRNGGAEIARMRRGDDGRWVATVGGQDLQPRDIQRTALMDAVGAYNGAVRAASQRPSRPLQPPPAQTELMAEYGIPAMRSAAFATPTTSSASGARVTGMGGSGSYDPDDDGDDDATVSGDTDKDGPGGLTPKGQAIYKKLIARGFPPARALAFARNSQNAKPGQFGKAS